MSELRAHLVALSVALFGPLLNLVIGFGHPTTPPYVYVYWLFCLLLYVSILLPFTWGKPLVLLKLIPLGVAVEDFFSNMWRHLILGCSESFLPFGNWYTGRFPFLGMLGEPTPYLLIPRWYFLAFGAYILISFYQKLVIQKKIKGRKKPIST